MITHLRCVTSHKREDLGTWDLSYGVKQQVHEADHLPASIARVKNAQKYTLIPPHAYGNNSTDITSYKSCVIVLYLLDFTQSNLTYQEVYRDVIFQLCKFIAQQWCQI